MNRLEDVDSSAADHALNAMRYGTQRITWAIELRNVWAM